MCVDKSKEVFVWQSAQAHQGDSYFQLKFSGTCDEAVKELATDWNANSSTAAKKLKGDSSALRGEELLRTLSKCRREVRVCASVERRAAR